MQTTSFRTRFVLIQTSHAGNVGAAARAIKVMGFDELVLVAPRWMCWKTPASSRPWTRPWTA